MNVTCEKCGEEYDDLDHWTYCPHEYFQMRTMAHAHGKSKLCTSLEELDEFLKGDTIEP